MCTIGRIVPLIGFVSLSGKSWIKSLSDDHVKGIGDSEGELVVPRIRFIDKSLKGLVPPTLEITQTISIELCSIVTLLIILSAFSSDLDLFGRVCFVLGFLRAE